MLNSFRLKTLAETMEKVNCKRIIDGSDDGDCSCQFCSTVDPEVIALANQSLSATCQSRLEEALDDTKAVPNASSVKKLQEESRAARSKLANLFPSALSADGAKSESETAAAAPSFPPSAKAKTNDASSSASSP